MVKGILKRHSSDSVASSFSQSSDSSSVWDDSPKQKRVSFDGAEPTRVFQADEWDRSPAEVTLRLTYKDVVELRELNVCLVRTGPVIMERTPSRRPTRQRTPTPPSFQSIEFPSRHSPARRSSPPLDDPVPGRLSPSYQYQPFSSQSLPPLLEDASSSPSTPPSDEGGRGHSVAASDSYFTFHPEPPSHSPPGLPLPAPLLKGLPSPALAPPSPLILSPPTSPPHSPNPKPRPLSLLRSESSHQRILGAPKPFPFPTLSRRASVPEELALESAKGKLVPASPTWKPVSVHANSSSPALGLEPPKRGMSLMGWELRRSASTNGRRGAFGLVRKGSTSA